MLKSFQRTLVMLEGKHSSGHKYGTLLAGHHALECRTECNLCLAEAHISAQKSVHGDRLFHVVLYLAGAFQLILSLHIVKAPLEFVLPVIIGVKGKARGLGTLGIQLDKLRRHILDGLADTLSCLLPFSGGKAVELYPLILPCTDIAGDKVKLCDRHIEHIRACILYGDIVLGNAVKLQLSYTLELPYAVE